MIVVADSGPLHYLILLNQADLLHRLYGQVIAPEAVFGELTVATAPQPVKDWLSRPPSWLHIQSVPFDETELVTALRFGWHLFPQFDEGPRILSCPMAFRTG